MHHKSYKIQVEGSNPKTKLVTYILDRSPEIMSTPKPLVLICPGGGYVMTSDREAEPIALAFNAQGYHAAVLRYSVDTVRYPVALREVAQAYALLYRNCRKWNIDPTQIYLQGSSAGGHLAMNYVVDYDDSTLLGMSGLTAQEARPAGVILSYPVITSGKHAHQGSFEALLGKPYKELTKSTSHKKLLQKLSLETRIRKDTPPVFVWHTFEDGCVPVENTLLLLASLRKAGVSAEAHVFPQGGHGLGLASEITVSPGGGEIQEECQVWPRLAGDWISRRRALAKG